MTDKRIDVILNLANAIGVAFIGLSGTVVVMWQDGKLLTPFGLIVYTGFFLLGFFTTALYVWAFRLTSS